jgi:hypothetical protein
MSGLTNSFASAASPVVRNSLVKRFPSPGIAAAQASGRQCERHR